MQRYIYTSEQELCTKKVLYVEETFLWHFKSS